MMHHGQGDRGYFPPLARARIENLACSEPTELGLEITHWSARTLEQVVVEQEIVTSIHYTTIAIILRRADLQPHRYRYWKTPVWDEAAISQADEILWCYEHVGELWEQSEVLICLDEKPNLQALERTGPKQLMQPGQIERQEFEYKRHGTVNLLAGLVVYTGQMWSECLDSNDGEHFRPAVHRLVESFPCAKRVRLIMDNGSSHTSHDTLNFFGNLAPRVQVLFTPPHASWLNQAELLLRAFSSRYIERGNWFSRQALIEHLNASRDEYNTRWGHPFTWSWTQSNFHDWLERDRWQIPCIIYATVH
jgi:hypothetical protein